MSALSPRTRAVGLALCAWTLITWTTRLPLAWRDEALSTDERVLATVPVVVFVALAAGAVVAIVTRRASAAGLLVVLAGWSAVYWLVRVPMIALNDHPAGFVAVHAVLGAVAIGLSALTGWRLWLDRGRASGPARGAVPGQAVVTGRRRARRGRRSYTNW